MWLQFDWGEGPRIGRRETLLRCAWLAWSRFRVVIPSIHIRERGVNSSVRASALRHWSRSSWVVAEPLSPLSGSMAAACASEDETTLKCDRQVAVCNGPPSPSV